jgi:SpoVK/Ycf46/Vps4 family AAA+-type ATPase
MKKEVVNRTNPLSQIIPKFLEAGLAGNRQRLELLSLNAIRAFKNDFPEMATELSSILSQFTANTGSIRWHQLEPPPADSDAGLALVRVQPVDSAVEPILDDRVQEQIERFVRDRMELQKLLEQGISPPRSILLMGAPGTGKTMMACWLAKTLNLRLVVLDLASSISSFLGRTGNNLRKSLDYARATPCVLLLDEFDAIGKRRDDVTEVGELKRIVNVLLKELEDWPNHSVLVAATNHPELLDPAINRRFDVTLELPLPGERQREAILSRASGHFEAFLPEHFLKTLTHVLAGCSGSELDTLAHSAIRRHIVDKVPLARCFLNALGNRIKPNPSKKELSTLIRDLQKVTGNDLTVRELAEIFGKSPSTVQYHLTREKNHA